MRSIIATKFGAQRVLFSRHALQRDAEQDFAHADAVERRRVDEVHTAVESDAHTFERFAQRDLAELLS